MHREVYISEHSVLKGLSLSNLSSHSSGNSAEEEAGKFQEPVGMEDIKAFLGLLDTTELKHI